MLGRLHSGGCGAMAALLMLVARTHAVTIGFEPLRIDDDQLHNWGAVEESGFRITGSPNAGMYTLGTSNADFKGSTALMNGENGRASNSYTRLTLVSADNVPFDLESLDIAPSSPFSGLAPQLYIVVSNAYGFTATCRIAITNTGTNFITLPLGLRNLMSASWCADRLSGPGYVNRYTYTTLSDNIVLDEVRHKENRCYRIVSTQQTEVISLAQDGVLTWTNSVSNALCRIETLRTLGENTNPRLLTAEFNIDSFQSWIRMPPGEAETPIVLAVFSDGWGSLLERRAVATNQPFVLYVDDPDPYYDPPRYYAYAHSDGCYTKLYRFTNIWSTTLTTDPVPVVPFTMTGALFDMQKWFAHCAVTNFTLSVTGPSGPLPDTTTDALGRYLITNAETGLYTVGFTYSDVSFSFQLTNTPGTDYQDLYFWDPLQFFAPNIYLYPETETTVQVALGFPNGGHVTLSEPAYTNGWNVNVTPDGLIDGRYPYLFYETLVPIPIDADTGWLLDGRNLETELRTLLANLGFVGREIDDFIEYWLPRLNGPSWYAVYLQQPEQMATFNISPAPQSVLRALFAFRALKKPIAMTAPSVTPFTRTGFTVVEWGVTGWQGE